MKEAYQYFFSNNKRPQFLIEKEIELYGIIFAYSQIENTGIDEDSWKFKASTLAAEELANSIRIPNYSGLDGTKLIGICSYDEEETLKFEYDIETGDLSSFIQ